MIRYVVTRTRGVRRDVPVSVPDPCRDVDVEQAIRDARRLEAARLDVSEAAVEVLGSY